MFKISRIVARIYDPPRGQMYRELGIQTVCPTTVGAKLIRDVLISAPWSSQTFEYGKLTSLAAFVGADEAGKRVADIEDAGKIRIAAVRRGPRDVMVASSELVLQEGDEISAVVSPDVIGDFARRFRSAANPAKVEAAT
jgi:trk system potassium uptake protein TrkA